MGKIIAFANQKGGVGKTTTCINVAAYIAAMGKKVLLIDMDPQGNTTSGVGIDKSNKELKTLYNVINKDVIVDEAIYPTCVEDLDIIPATVDLAGAEIDLVQMHSREHVVKNALARVKNKYDFIFIDCRFRYNSNSMSVLCIGRLNTIDEHNKTYYSSPKP